MSRNVTINYNTVEPTKEKVAYDKLRYNTYRKRVAKNNASLGFSIIGFVLSLLLLVSIVGILRGNGNYLTFKGLLELLGNTYYVPIDWIFTLNEVTVGDWGFYIGELFVNFNFLKVVYNFIAPIIQVVLYLCTGIAQVFIFLITFLRILFVGA